MLVHMRNTATATQYEARGRARKVEAMLAALEAHLPTATTADLLAVVKLANADGGSLLRQVAELAGVRTPSDTTLAALEGRLEGRLTTEAIADPFAGLA